MPEADITERADEVLISLATRTRRSGTQLGLSFKTIQAHKADAMRKFGMAGCIDIVKYGILRDGARDN